MFGLVTAGFLLTMFSCPLSMSEVQELLVIFQQQSPEAAIELLDTTCGNRIIEKEQQAELPLIFAVESDIRRSATNGSSTLVMLGISSDRYERPIYLIEIQIPGQPV